MRFIQSSMANATVLQNYVHEIYIAKYYLVKAKVSKSHTSVTVSLKKIFKISKSVLQEKKNV